MVIDGHVPPTTMTKANSRELSAITISSNMWMTQMSTKGCLSEAPIERGGVGEAGGDSKESVGSSHTAGSLRSKSVEHDNLGGMRSQTREGARGSGAGGDSVGCLGGRDGQRHLA
jgi:hypothetical protein